MRHRFVSIEIGPGVGIIFLFCCKAFYLRRLSLLFVCFNKLKVYASAVLFLACVLFRCLFSFLFLFQVVRPSSKWNLIGRPPATSATRPSTLRNICFGFSVAIWILPMKTCVFLFIFPSPHPKFSESTKKSRQNSFNCGVETGNWKLDLWLKKSILPFLRCSLGVVQNSSQKLLWDLRTWHAMKDLRMHAVPKTHVSKSHAAGTKSCIEHFIWHNLPQKEMDANNGSTNSKTKVGASSRIQIRLPSHKQAPRAEQSISYHTTCPKRRWMQTRIHQLSSHCPLILHRHRKLSSVFNRIKNKSWTFWEEDEETYLWCLLSGSFKTRFIFSSIPAHVCKIHHHCLGSLGVLRFLWKDQGGILSGLVTEESWKRRTNLIKRQFPLSNFIQEVWM